MSQELHLQLCMCAMRSIPLPGIEASESDLLDSLARCIRGGGSRGVSMPNLTGRLEGNHKHVLGFFGMTVGFSLCLTNFWFGRGVFLAYHWRSYTNTNHVSFCQRLQSVLGLLFSEDIGKCVCACKVQNLLLLW